MSYLRYLATVSLFLLVSSLLVGPVWTYQAFEVDDLSIQGAQQLYMKDASHLPEGELDKAAKKPIRTVSVDCTQVNWKDDNALVRYASQFVSHPDRVFRHRTVKRTVLPIGLSPPETIDRGDDALKTEGSVVEEARPRNAPFDTGNDLMALIMYFDIEIVYPAQRYNSGDKGTYAGFRKDDDDAGAEEETEVIRISVQSKEPPQFLQWPHKGVEEKPEECAASVLDTSNELHSYLWDSAVITKDTCGGNVKINKFSYFTKTDYPNHGVWIDSWEAVNDFWQKSHVMRFTSIHDTKPPMPNVTASRILCLVDTEHISSRVDSPKLCPAVLLDNYARSYVFSDNCDKKHQLGIFFAQRATAHCSGVERDKAMRKIAGETKEKGSNVNSAAGCNAVETPLDDKGVPMYQNTFQAKDEKCFQIPTGTMMRYMVTAGDLGNNVYPHYMAFGMYFVDSPTSCPEEAFVMESYVSLMREVKVTKRS